MEIRSKNYVFGSRLTTEEDDTIPRLILPFMGPLTTRLTRYIRTKMDCNFGYLPGQKIGRILNNTKGKQSTEENTIGIYKITCSCDMTYIGETERSLSTRYKEHMNTESAITTHLHENPSHHINENSASLIEREPRRFHRKFKERLWILKTNNNLNINGGMNLNPIWEITCLRFMDNH